MSRPIASALMAANLLLLATQSHGFELSGPGWSAGEATLHTSPVSSSGSGLGSTQLRDAYIAALGEWNSRTAFTFKTTTGSAHPCDALSSNSNPNLNSNGYTFASSPCMNAFGSTTLAVATTWRQGTGGTGQILQSGIVFNSAKDWGIYTGPASPGSGFDFKRVVVHELGHSLGLRHTTVSPAIMLGSIGNIEVPQTDDLNGAAALYGLPAVMDINISPLIMLLLE